MDKDLFPKEIIRSSAEYHFGKHQPKTMVIYQMILILLLLAGVAIVVVKVDVSVNGPGILRSVNEHATVKALVGGRIDEVFVSANQYVEKDQVLATIRTEGLVLEQQLLSSQRTEFQHQANDLERLTKLLRNRSLTNRPSLASSVYNQQFSLFWQRLAALRNREELARKNRDRHSALHERKFISAAEYEQVTFAHEQAERELETLYDEQGAIWQADLQGLRLRGQELDTRSDQVASEREFYTLRAPVSGIVLSMKGFQAGSAIAVNEQFAELSPDSDLIAEVYVPSKDIGFIQTGSTVNFQVTAYDYNQWGMVAGRVQSVSPDIFTDREQPYFKVRCLLDKHELQLKNGYVGNLKKGMTLQARFFVARRTLFQLLYDTADDWLNPYQATAMNQ